MSTAPHPTKATGHGATSNMCLIGEPSARYRPSDGHMRRASGGRGGDVAEKSGTAGGRKAAGNATADTGSATVRSFPDRGPTATA